MRFLAVLLIVLFSSPAWAKQHHHHHHRWHIHGNNAVAVGLGVGLARVLESARPRDCYGIPWCGCAMRHWLGVSDKRFNRAIEWRHYGHPSAAKVGAVVVWRHHVGLITGGHPGAWVVTSGNDGHAVRSRRRSLQGVVAIRA